MKQLTCEMCGSTELIKDGGFFVCQTCGCKYSVEEAKKMMIEGTVDVQGTVKVDNSAFVEKYLANARRAKQKEDWEETEKYYNMVEQNDPTNIEAIFYSSYGKAKRSLVDSDIYKREAAFKVLQNCVSIIDDNFNIEKEEEQKEIIYQIMSDVCAMACSGYVYNQRTSQYGAVTTDKSKTEVLFIRLIDELITTIDNIIPKYSSEDAKKSIYLYEMMIDLHSFQIDNMGLTKTAKNLRAERIVDIHERIHAIDPSHEVPERAVNAAVKAKEANKISRGSIWTTLLMVGMGILAFGAFMFILLGEARYFGAYLRLRGYIGGVNTLFILDYLCVAVGAVGTFVSGNSNGKKTSVSTILGIVGFVFAWLFAIVGHGLAIAGIIVGAKEAKASDSKVGLNISILAEVCAALSSLLGIVLMLSY